MLHPEDVVKIVNITAAEFDQNCAPTPRLASLLSCQDHEPDALEVVDGRGTSSFEVPLCACALDRAREILEHWMENETPFVTLFDDSGSVYFFMLSAYLGKCPDPWDTTELISASYRRREVQHLRQFAERDMGLLMNLEMKLR